MFGSVSVKKERGKTVNSHKKLREKLKKFKETVFEMQNTRFSLLKQVARASHQNTQSENCEKFSKCFSRLEGPPKHAFCVPLTTGPFTHEQVAKNNTRACGYSMRLR